VARLPVDAADLREFLGRDWSRVEDANRAHWRLEVRERGPAVLLHATAGLADHMRTHLPGGPRLPSDLTALGDLIRFKQRLDAASLAFHRRSRPG
jgi:hypothetical protein